MISTVRIYRGSELEIGTTIRTLPNYPYFRASSENIIWRFNPMDIFYKRFLTKNDWRFYSMHKNYSFLKERQDQIVASLKFLIDPLSELGISFYKCDIEYKKGILYAYVPHPRSLLNLSSANTSAYSNWLRTFGFE